MSDPRVGQSEGIVTAYGRIDSSSTAPASRSSALRRTSLPSRIDPTMAVNVRRQPGRRNGRAHPAERGRLNAVSAPIVSDYPYGTAGANQRARAIRR